MSSNYQKFLDDSENDNVASKKEKLKEIQQTLQQQSDDHLAGKNENTLQFKKDQLSDNNLKATYYTSNLQNNSTNNEYQKKRKQRMSKDIKPKGVKKHNLPFNSAIHNNENVFRLTTYSLSFDIDLQFIQKNLGKFIQANKYCADQSLQEKTVLILKNIESPDYKVIFLFEFGVIVFWGLSESEESAIYDHINNLNEDFKFPNLFKPKLDLKIEEPEPDLIYFSYLPSDSNKTIDQNDILHLTGTQLSEKLAFSYAQAQSIKLETYEIGVEDIIEQTKDIPKELADSGAIKLSQKQISKLQGQLFQQRSDINLNSNLLDTPDYFWNEDEFEKQYIYSRKWYNIPTRIKILNSRLDIIKELYDMLNEELHHQHESYLEWIIIWILVLEVAITLIWNILIKDVLGYFDG